MSAVAQTWWQRLPECLAAGGTAVLVTVVHSAGSAPRDAGATLLVEADRSTDTVGGGNLEFEAIRLARALLDPAGPPADVAMLPIVPYTLGPALRQCCGGAVWLLFECIPAHAAASAEWLGWSQALQRGDRLLRQWSASDRVSRWRVLTPLEHFATELVQTPGQRWQQVIGADAFQVRLFGAGHVGRALAQVLAHTGACLQWIDSRPAVAVEHAALSVPVQVFAEPVEAVHRAPPASWYLVMTHSHTLDFELVEAILRRGDAAFCGLIGSATKAARFRHNLQREGLDAARVAGLTCPVGIAGLHDKAPASVAIAVAAQLLLLRETAQQREAASSRTHLIARHS